MYRKDIVNEKLHAVNISIFIKFMIWFRFLHVMISRYNWIKCDNKGKDDNDCNVLKCNVCNNKSADI